MSIVVAMRTPNGTVIGADGLITQYYTGEMTCLTTKLYKYPLSIKGTDICVGMVGKGRYMQSLKLFFDDILNMNAPVISHIKGVDDEYNNRCAIYNSLKSLNIDLILQHFLPALENYLNKLDLIFKDDTTKGMGNCSIMLATYNKIVVIHSDLYLTEYRSYATIGSGDEKVIGFLDGFCGYEKSRLEKEYGIITKSYKEYAAPLACDDMPIIWKYYREKENKSPNTMLYIAQSLVSSAIDCACYRDSCIGKTNTIYILMEPEDSKKEPEDTTI